MLGSPPSSPLSSSPGLSTNSVIDASEPIANSLINPIIVSPRNIIGPNFISTNELDYNLLIDVADIINNVVNPVEQNRLISLMQGCISIDDMLTILEQVII